MTHGDRKQSDGSKLHRLDIAARKALKTYERRTSVSPRRQPGQKLAFQGGRARVPSEYARRWQPFMRMVPVEASTLINLTRRTSE